jgi:cytochrome c oxidase cbb3-type subunit 3
LYGTIIFAAWYCGYYLSGHGPGSRQELAGDMKVISDLRAQAAPPPTQNNSQDLLAAYKDPAKLKHGAEVFVSKCVACHGDKGQGVIGPNLTDDYWIHGKGTLADIAEVVATGVPDKGMPPWGPVLAPDELRDVVAFVHSLHGTNPPGAKPPQGDLQQFAD